MVKWVTFLGSLHWPAGGLDLGVGGISFVELFTLYELWAGERLSLRLCFKLASGLGESWTRDGGIPQGCPWSMMLIVALYLPWCRYLNAQVGVQPQLYADNLKCLSRIPDLLLSAAMFTTRYVRLVGQEPAPGKCVLLSTSREVRKDMKDWVLSQDGDRWSVKFDVRDLGGHLDTTFRGWSSTLATRVRLPAHLAGYVIHSRPRVWKRLSHVDLSNVSDSDHKRRRCDQNDGGLHSFSCKDWGGMIPWVCVGPCPLGCTILN